MSSSGELEDWVETTRSGVLTLAAAFFFGLSVTGLVAALDFSLAS
jgi:hypothetical protein